jgi:hypothetical protein
MKTKKNMENFAFASENNVTGMIIRNFKDVHMIIIKSLLPKDSKSRLDLPILTRF